MCVSARAQKIKKEYDKFLKATRVSTGYIRLRSTLSAPLSATIRSVGDKYFVTFYGSNVGATTIGPSDPAMILLENDSTVQIFPTKIQSYEIGQYGRGFHHEYSIPLNLFEQIIRFKVKSIRKYGSSGYVDFEIDEKGAKNFSKTCKEFMEAVEKTEIN